MSAAGGEKERVDGLPLTTTRLELDVFLSELKGAANTKSWERALELLDDLHEAGYDPHPGAYACAIRYAEGCINAEEGTILHVTDERRKSNSTTKQHPSAKYVSRFFINTWLYHQAVLLRAGNTIHSLRRV